MGYYQYTSPADGTCSTDAVSTSSVTVTGLDPATSYTFKAYSDSSCNTAIGSAAAFTTLTPGLTASNVTGTTARLTIANWRPGTGANKDGNWYYQYTDPVGGFCSTAQSAASANVDTLTPGQAYTFAAYSDRDCANLLATADAFFATDATVSNLGETASSTFGVSNDHDWATSFTTGSHARGYTLGSVVARFAADPDDSIKVAAKIYSDSSGAPGTLVATLAGPDGPDNEDAVYTCSGSSCALSASTTYHLAIEKSEGSLSATVRPWRNTASDGQTNTPSNAGWSIGNSSSRKASGAWTANQSANSGMFSIAATQIDGLSVSDVRATTATLTIAGHSGDWYYKHTVPSNGTCTAAGSGASTNVTGLTAATAYTFRAYSNSSCSTAISGASVSFTTLPSLVAWITNLSTPKVSTGKVLNASRQQAVAFTTGSAPGGYRLKTFTAALRVGSDGNGSMTVKLHPMQGSGPYGATSAPSATVLATLAGAGPARSSWQDLTWTCPGAGCDLAAGTTYFVVMTYTGTGSYSVAYGSGQTVTRYPSDNGWNVRYGHYKASSSNWASMSDHSLARFDFQPRPGLAASATTATLTLSGHTGNWWLKRTTPADTTCKPKGTAATEDLTGLTKSTAYVYQAYSDSTCSTTLGPGASFSTLTPTLTSSSVTHNSATLTLAGWDVSKDGAWYYRQGTSGTCTAAGNTLTVTIAGLDPNTPYTYTAFTDSACGSTNQIAAAPSFTTPSAFAASAITATTATLTLSGHTAVWYYQADKAPHNDTCTQVVANTASVNVTGLTKSTAYVYTAYSDSSCNNSLAAVPSFTTTTPALTASAITRSTATLTLTGWAAGTGTGKDGNWWLKRIALLETPCTSKGSTTTESLSDLTINTDYTYKAYSDATCSTELAAADAFFTGDTVSNLGETKAAAGNVGQSSTTNIKWAVGFTTGPSTHGYGVQSVTARFDAKVGSPSDITAAIHAAASGNPAATATCDLTGSDPDTAGEHTFTTSTCNLSAGTTYYLVLSATGTSGEFHYYRLGLTASDSQTNTPSTAGWTIADLAKVKIGSADWTDHSASRTGMLAVKANVLTPSLTASAITGSGATLSIADHSGTWYYKRIVGPADNTCHTVSSGTTATLGSLDANKLYGYTAYRNSGCSTGTLDTVYFSTSSAFVGNLAEASTVNCVIGYIGALAQCTTAFTTGSNSLGYTLGAVTARFAAKVGSPGAIVAAIHAANGSNPADSASITLSGSDPDAAGLHTFTCSTGCDLAKDTTYFVVFSSPTSTSGLPKYYSWQITTSDDKTLWPAGSGWAIADAGRYKSGTAAWAAMTLGRTGVMHVTATAKTARSPRRTSPPARPG